MNDDVIPLLKMHEYFRGAPDEALRDVAAAARVAQHAAGAVVHEADAPVVTVGFVLRGRLKAVRVDARGGESLFRMIDRGEQYLRALGLIEVRVRYHRGDVARLEVPASAIERLCQAEIRQLLVAHFRGLGFKFITLDLEGFRSGSLNQLVALG